MQEYVHLDTKNKQDDKGEALGYFGLQLILNGLWTPIFFVIQNVLISLYVIVALDIVVLVSIVLFYNINKRAGILLIPYSIWLTIATALNASIAFLN